MVVTDPQTKQTHKQTHKQTGTITIHCVAKLSAQCNTCKNVNINLIGQIVTDRPLHHIQPGLRSVASDSVHFTHPTLLPTRGSGGVRCGGGRAV